MIHNKFRYLLTLVALFAMTAGAWAAQVELKLGAKIKNGDVLTFGDTRVHFTTPCSRPYAIFSAVNTSTNVTIGYDENAQLGYMLNDTYIAFTPLVDVSKGQDDCFSGEGESLGLYTGQTIPEYVMVTDGTGTYADPFILTSYATYNCGGSPVDGKAICDASDPSALKVDWNKASKTGTFKMPGGNVELEPEYYPQAALTAQPTAINDVPATTDGAIVKAGTVANIGSTETAQGTVMYYVSPTPMTDAQLLALAADQWTADVPTAKSLAEGKAYVYYYVRGNDSDTDDENFSDGDILSANALTVTIAAAPTYAVTFADDLAEPTKWTASPAANVTKGQTVTVTYTGSKKVLGVKAEKKAAAPVEVLTYSFDDASHPSGLTAGSRVSFDYSRTSVITNSNFLNAYNNTNGDPDATTVSLGDTDLSGETWTLSFEWAACGGCNSKPDHTTLKAGNATLFDLSGNSNWNTTVTIIYTGSDGSKTLPVPGCDKSNRFTEAVGDQYNTTNYWHHIVVKGSAEGVKMTITNSSTGAAVVEDVVLSETNVNPTSLIIEPCCGGGIGIDALSLTYEE